MVSGWRFEVVVFLLIVLNAELCCSVLLRTQGLESPDATAVRNPVTRWRMKNSHGAQVNADGLRDHEVTQPPEARETRVLCLGGSVTFGAGVERDENTYVRRLGAMLEARMPPGQTIDVINGGQSGYGLHDHILLFNDLGERYRPQVVTVMLGYNENWSPPDPPTLPAQGKLGGGRSMRERLHSALYRSSTYRYLSRRLVPDAPAEDTTQSAGGPYWRRSEANLRLFHAFLERNGIRMVVAIEALRGIDSLKRLDSSGGGPYKGLLPSHDPTQYGEMRKTIVQACTDMGCPVVDMTPVFSASGYTEDQLFQANDPVHLTVMGNRLVAAAIARTIWAQAWFPSQ